MARRLAADHARDLGPYAELPAVGPVRAHAGLGDGSAGAAGTGHSGRLSRECARRDHPACGMHFPAGESPAPQFAGLGRRAWLPEPFAIDRAVDRRLPAARNRSARDMEGLAQQCGAPPTAAQDRLVDGGAMTRWLAHMPEGTGPVVVCFPFAGGGASAFAAWRRALQPDLCVCAVQPPGREGRSAEARFRDYPAFRDALSQALLPVLVGRRAVFYGHSLGAWVAWDVARALSAAGTAPLGLIVGAQRAPSCPYPFRHESTMADSELAGFLSRFDGLPAGLTDSFIQWMLPLVRDDLRLCETHPTTNVKENFPIGALGGRPE